MGVRPTHCPPLQLLALEMENSWQVCISWRFEIMLFLQQVDWKNAVLVPPSHKLL